jgi:hypothetical protein
MTMRSYDVPGGTSGLTAAEAKMAVNKLHADARSDLEHPLLTGSHPQHQDFVRFSSELHRIIIQDEADQQDAAAAAKLEAARAIVGDRTPAESLARGRELLKTPGYLDGKMEPKERAALKRQIDAAFLVGCQEPEPEPSTEEMENSDDL